MKWGPTLRPVCMPEQINQSPRGDYLVATGWGFQNFKIEKYARILQQAQLNIYPLEECLLAYKTYLKREVFNSQICTFQEEQDTCQVNCCLEF